MLIDPDERRTVLNLEGEGRPEKRDWARVNISTYVGVMTDSVGASTISDSHVAWHRLGDRP